MKNFFRQFDLLDLNIRNLLNDKENCKLKILISILKILILNIYRTLITKFLYFLANISGTKQTTQPIDANYVEIKLRQVRYMNKVVIDLAKQSNSMPTGIYALPRELLAKIFSNLNFRSLCCSEQVCKSWQACARQFWSNKTDITLNNFTVFGQEDHFQFSKSSHPNRVVSSILNKLTPANITKADFIRLSTYLMSAKESTRILEIELEFLNKCKKLTSLKIGSCTLNILNTNTNNLLKKFFSSRPVCANIKHLSFAGNIVNDTSLEMILENCTDLESIRLQKTPVTGQCFEEIKGKPNLKSLELDLLFEFSDDIYPVLLSKIPNLKQFKVNSLSESEAEAEYNFLPLITEKLKKLEGLDVPLIGNSLQAVQDMANQLTNLQRIVFCTSESLEFCKSTVSSQTISYILNSCKSLKHLKLNDISKYNVILSEAFTTLPIICPLETLEALDCEFGDSAFDAFYQISSSLRIVKLMRMKKVTSKGVVKLLESCSKLERLEFHAMPKIDESVLEKALELGRSILITCAETKVDVVAFLKGKKEFTDNYVLKKEHGEFKAVDREIKMNLLTLVVTYDPYGK